MITTHITQWTATTTGPEVELARYDSDTGVRTIIGQRLDGVVHVFDRNVDDCWQPMFLVEAGLEHNSELRALVDDYLAKAKRLGYAPMHGWF